MKTQRWFSLTIPDDILRKMTRAEYKKAQRWVRCCARMIAAEMEKDKNEKPADFAG